MARPGFLLPAVLAVGVATASGGGYTAYQAFTGAGLSLAPATPEAIVPASADIYVAYNHSSAQQAELNRLWTSYRTHPGTAAAITHLQSSMSGQQSGLSKQCTDTQQKTNSLISSLGDNIALAVWTPPSGSSAPARTAIIAQTKVSNILTNSSAQLQNVATLASAFAYHGTQVYTVTPKGACSSAGRGPIGYAALVSGDVVLVPKSGRSLDGATMRSIIDASQGRVVTLRADRDYTAAVATLPASRLLTIYVSKNVSAQLQRQVGSAAGGVSSGLSTRAYAFDVTAAAGGIGFDTSALPASTLGTTGASATPNQGASIVSGNTVLYLSLNNLGGVIRSYLNQLPPRQLAQMQQQLGINLQRDVLSWMNGEAALDINAGTSPALVQYGPSLASGLLGGKAPAHLPATPPPGAVEIAVHVDNPVAVQQSLDRIAAAAARSAKERSLFTTSKLADGTVVHNLTGVPGVGYAIRNHWLIVSTNLSADLAVGSASLAADPDYKAALTHITGSGAVTGVSYFSTTRLLNVIDQWIAYVNKIKPGTVPTRPSSPNGWTWSQVEPLIAPLHSIISYAQRTGASDVQGHLFIAVK